MTKLVWGLVGDRFYQTGADRGVLYIDGSGVPWNGLISVTESPSGGSPTPYYLDGIKYLNLSETEDFEATIKAFSSPTEFDRCDGTVSLYPGLFVTQQPRKQFGFSYRTRVGNDVDGIDHGYKIHLVYNALASPSERENTTLSDSPSPIIFSWAITTTPPIFSGYKPSAHMVIDSRTTPGSVLMSIEDILYGSDSSSPRLPLPDELLSIFRGSVALDIVANADGSYTAEGTAVTSIDSGTFTMDDANVVDNSDGSFTAYS